MGFFDDLEETYKSVGKVVTTTAKTAAVVSTSAAGLTATGFYYGGKAVKELAKENDNEVLENLGKLIEEAGTKGMNSITGGEIEKKYLVFIPAASLYIVIMSY
ncbi:hypothetical protein C1645_818031 [Glomus cerebriforme]|uniref:Senescence domain-containing protein n=1 Tax=Glomus cerebriforme TaxID=658196 RepID=A0A397T862_9GLOM|nr:hypothetical protein C1645_818031 [Glomus cerebriforme]